MILPMNPAPRRLGTALLLVVTSVVGAGCSQDGRHLRSPYPPGTDCARGVCRHLRDLGPERSELVHSQFGRVSCSKVTHDWWAGEPCCR